MNYNIFSSPLCFKSLTHNVCWIFCKLITSMHWIFNLISVSGLCPIFKKVTRDAQTSTSKDTLRAWNREHRGNSTSSDHRLNVLVNKYDNFTNLSVIFECLNVAHCVCFETFELETAAKQIMQKKITQKSSGSMKSIRTRLLPFGSEFHPPIPSNLRKIPSLDFLTWILWPD